MSPAIYLTIFNVASALFKVSSVRLPGSYGVLSEYAVLYCTSSVRSDPLFFIYVFICAGVCIATPRPLDAAISAAWLSSADASASASAAYTRCIPPAFTGYIHAILPAMTSAMAIAIDFLNLAICVPPYLLTVMFFALLHTEK